MKVIVFRFQIDRFVPTGPLSEAPKEEVRRLKRLIGVKNFVRTFSCSNTSDMHGVHLRYAFSNNFSRIVEKLNERLLPGEFYIHETERKRI